MIRGRVKSVIEGVIKRFSAAGRAGEDIDNREYIQHYGFTSRPLAGAEVIIIREGGQFIAVASDDRRYRIAVEDGEVAIYTDEGDTIHLKRHRVIEINGGERVVITTKVAEIIASSKCIMTTPLLQVSGDIISGGNITAAGDVADANGDKTMAGMRKVFNNHAHPHPSDGVPIPKPNEAM